MKDKKHKSIANKDKKPLDDQYLENFERDFDFGNGVSLTIETSNPKTGKNDTTYHYSTKLDKLKTKGGELSVAVSSIEAENQELLHFLFKKSRE